MKKNNVSFILLIIFFIIIQNNLIANQMSVFEIPSGYRNAGLAGAVVALPEDPESWAVNPSSTARLLGWDGAFQNIFWLYDMNRFDLTAGKNMRIGPLSGFLTGSLRLFYPGQFINYDQWGYEKSSSRAWDSSLAVGYAMQVIPYLPFLDAGLAMKWIHRTYDPGQDNALTLDIGFLSRFKVFAFRDQEKQIMKENLFVGLSFRNLPGKIGPDSLQSEMRLGAVYRPIAACALFADYGLVFQSVDTFKIAVEYNFIGQFFARMGYAYSESGLSITPGIGFQFLAGRFKYEVEYAFLPLSVDRNVHSIGFRMSLPDNTDQKAIPEYLKIQKMEDRSKDIEKQLLEDKLKLKEMEIDMLKNSTEKSNKKK